MPPRRRIVQVSEDCRRRKSVEDTMHVSAFTIAWSELQAGLALIPDSVRTIIFVLIAIVVALVIHTAAAAVMRRALARGRPFLHSLFVQLEGPARLALVLFALNVAVSVSPLEPTLGTALSRSLQLTFIA